MDNLLCWPQFSKRLLFISVDCCVSFLLFVMLNNSIVDFDWDATVLLGYGLTNTGIA